MVNDAIHADRPGEFPCQLKHQAAVRILVANRPLLEEAAQHLLKQEVLEGETLDAYWAKAQMPPGIDEWLKTGEVDIALAQASN